MRVIVKKNGRTKKVDVTTEVTIVEECGYAVRARFAKNTFFDEDEDSVEKVFNEEEIDNFIKGLKRALFDTEVRVVFD